MIIVYSLNVYTNFLHTNKRMYAQKSKYIYIYTLSRLPGNIKCYLAGHLGYLQYLQDEGKREVKEKKI